MTRPPKASKPVGKAITNPDATPRMLQRVSHAQRVAKAMQQVPQLRQHHVERTGWDHTAPHMVPRLGDVRDEARQWVWPALGSVQHTQDILERAGVNTRARVKVVEHEGRVWAMVTTRKRAPIGRDELAVLLGAAGENPVMPLRGWVPIDHPAVKKHVPKGLRR